MKQRSERTSEQIFFVDVSPEEQSAVVRSTKLRRLVTSENRRQRERFKRTFSPDFPLKRENEFRQISLSLGERSNETNISGRLVAARQIRCSFDFGSESTTLRLSRRESERVQRQRRRCSSLRQKNKMKVDERPTNKPTNR